MIDTDALHEARRSAAAGPAEAPLPTQHRCPGFISGAGLQSCSKGIRDLGRCPSCCDSGWVTAAVLKALGEELRRLS